MLFPLSAVILRNSNEYDQALESFSRPLSELIRDYRINDRGEMIVEQETADYYKFIDFTPIAERLYQWVEETIHTDLEKELDFLSRYDAIRESVKQVVDLPDKELDLFIRCVRQNGGTLSKLKRESWFHMLSDQEISQMEAAVRAEA